MALASLLPVTAVAQETMAPPELVPPSHEVEPEATPAAPPLEVHGFVSQGFIKNGYARAKFPAERLVDLSYADFAVQKLGPFVLANKDSKLEGCR